MVTKIIKELNEFRGAKNVSATTKLHSMCVYVCVCTRVCVCVHTDMCCLSQWWRILTYFELYMNLQKNFIQALAKVCQGFPI